MADNRSTADDPPILTGTLRAIFRVKAYALTFILTVYWILELFVSHFRQGQMFTLVVIASLLPTLAVLFGSGTVAPWFLRLSLCVDAIVLSLGIHIGGGVDNVSMPLLYTAIISLAGLLLTRGDTFAVAVLAATTYDAVVYAEYVGVLPHLVEYARPPHRQLATVVPVNLFMLLYAWLVSSAMARIRALYQETEDLRRDAIHSLSHDLKNPLSIIHGYARMLPAAPSAEHERLTHGIERTAQQALDLVSNVVDAAAFEGRPIAPRVEPIRLDDLVGEVVDRYRHLAEAASVQLTCAPGSAALAEIDGQLVARAVGNLIANAIKYTSPNGAVRVTTARNDGTVSIGVSDTGVGIPANELDLLFRKYSRTSSARGIEGSGLGLYIVRCIAEAHGGGVNVTSTVGTGSTFILTLPVVARLQ